MGAFRVTRVIRNFGRTLGIAIVAFLVLSAALLSAARVLLPRAHEYTHTVEQLLGETLNAPVRIGSLDAAWHHFGPQLVVNDVRVLDALTRQELVRFDRARLDFNLLASISDRKLGLNGVAIDGIRVIVERTDEGRLRVVGLGSASTQVGAFDSALLESWLFGDLRWDIEDSEIEWRDARSDRGPRMFTAVNARLRNSGEHHEFSGSLRLPAGMGDEVRFGADIDGDPLQPETWRGTVYTAARNIQLAELARESGFVERVAVTRGVADLELWTHWGGGMQRATGIAGIQEIAIASGGADVPDVAFARLGAQWKMVRTAGGWRVDFQRLHALRDGRAWPETQAMLQFETVPDSEWPSVDARMTFARIEDLAAIARSWPTLSGSARGELAATDPRGDLRDVAFSFHPGVEHARYRLHADAIGLALNAGDGTPGFTGVNGRVVASERGGRIDLHNTASVLDLPRLFRGPLPLGAVDGEVHWEIDPLRRTWRVGSDLLKVSGVDGEVDATLVLEKTEADGAPYIDLVASFKNGDGHQVSRYLPAAVMPVSVVGWLDRAIDDGRVADGGIVLHGPLDQFPFTNGAGRFEVRARVENGALDYLPGWPRIEAIDTELVFSGHSLELRGNAARILDSSLHNVYATIPDMTSPYAILTVSGDIRGDSADPLAFIQQAPPLNARVGRDLADLAVRGASDLHLELAIPLGRELSMDTRFSAHARVRDNTLALGDFGPLLTRLDGTLVVDNDGIRGSRLKAELLQQPATLDVTTAVATEGALIHVRGRGALIAPTLMARFQPEWAERVAGRGRWTADLKLPLQQTKGSAKRLRVEALFDDVVVRLPQPLGKPAGETLLVEVNAELGNAEHKLYVQYGNRVGMGLALTPGGDGLRVVRGEVRFGDVRASIPRQAGLRIGGNLPKFSLDEWRSDPGFAGFWNDDGQGKPAKRDASPLVSDVDVHFNRLIAFGQPLSDAHVKVVRGSKEWQATVLSQEFSGRLRVPIALQQDPILMDVDEWKYIPVEGGSRAKLDPREIPAMQIQAKKFSYGDVDFGRLELKATKFAYGWRVDALQLVAPMTMVNGSGAWTYDGDTHQSHFNLDVISENVGQTMSKFGYADSIDGGSGNINAQLAWAAPLPDVSPELLDGRVAMDFKKGRMLEVSPGAGRLFALLSIQALPRRLSLDFSDLFAKGFAFDEINGEFRLERGEAYTSTLAMNGPAAKIRAAGRIGLGNHDYDQLVRVIPDLTGSVPTLTTLAVSPQIGVVTFVLGKIFQTQIDAATAVDYTITGSWENPQIERIIPPDAAGPVTE
jgi:uncharacterized protein (TIGR02099 family)